MVSDWQVALLTLACALITVQSKVGTYTDETTETNPVEREGECPSDNWYSSGSSCYYHLEGEFDFYEAMQSCSDLQNGATLATFRDQSQYYHVHHIVAHQNQHHKQPLSSGTWIGLMRDGDGWLWTDGTEFTYTDFWLPSEIERGTEEGDCGYIPDNRVGYAISECHDRRTALCEMTPEQYTVGEQQRRLKDVVIVAIVMAFVVVGGVAVLAIGIAKYCSCCRRTPKDKGYRIHKDRDSWI